MIRKDREITDLNDIFNILWRCDSIRLGIRDEEYPYIVPVSFGLCMENDSIVLYFHGAKAGKKAELLAKEPAICVEADIFYGIDMLAHGITARYESIIGYGTVELLSGKGKELGLQAMTEHYSCPEYPIERCKGLEMTNVYKLTISHISGKRNIAQ